MAAPSAEELHQLRVKACNNLAQAIRHNSGMGVIGYVPIDWGPPDPSLLDALNAIAGYTHAQKAWHDAHSGPEDPPIWIDPWED
jgi:hypothetical protein